MTVSEMTYEFDKVLETIDSDFAHKNKPDTATKLMCLNITQERYFLQKYLNTENYKERVLNFNKYYDEIKNLVNTTNINMTNSTSYELNSHYIVVNGTNSTILSTIYYLPLSNLTGYVGLMDVYLNTTGGVNTTSAGLNPCIYKDFIEFKAFLINQNNIPILPRPIFTIKELDLIITRDKYTTTNGTALITFVRSPKYMVTSGANSSQVTTCELATYLHESLVNQSVMMYITDYKQYQKPKKQQEQQPQKQ